MSILSLGTRGGHIHFRKRCVPYPPTGGRYRQCMSADGTGNEGLNSAKGLGSINITDAILN